VGCGSQRAAHQLLVQNESAAYQLRGFSDASGFFGEAAA
jgi:hypothetical protein